MGEDAFSRWTGARDAMSGGASLVIVLLVLRGVGTLANEWMPVPESLVAWLMAKHGGWEVARAMLPWLLAGAVAAALVSFVGGLGVGLTAATPGRVAVVAGIGLAAVVCWPSSSVVDLLIGLMLIAPAVLALWTGARITSRRPRPSE